MDTFMREWFRGLDKGLENLQSEQQEKVLKECGKACSESYTKELYQRYYERVDCIHDFFSLFNQQMPELEVFLVKKDEIYDVVYQECSCDLVRKGYVKTPRMCTCSKQSLLNNMEALVGEGKVEVEKITAILEGANECRFRIRLL